MQWRSKGLRVGGTMASPYGGLGLSSQRGSGVKLFELMKVKSSLKFAYFCCWCSGAVYLLFNLFCIY
jgi:hypothetical protein